MAIQVLSDALAALRRILNPVGGVVRLDRFDFRSPVSFVYDLRRMQDTGAFRSGPTALVGGYWELIITNTHAAADTQDGTAAVDTELAAIDADPALWSWLMEVNSQAADADITSARVSVSRPRFPGNTLATASEWFVAFFNSTNQVAATVASLDFLMANSNAATGLQGMGPYFQRMPFPLFRGSSIRMRSISSAASSIRMSALIWTGPIGVFPPGMS
jgi:hypothetical protein